LAVGEYATATFESGSERNQRNQSQALDVAKGRALRRPPFVDLSIDTVPAGAAAIVTGLIVK